MEVKENTDLKTKEIVMEIDFSEEIKEDVAILRDFAFICRFIGGTPDRTSIKTWIRENWKMKVLIRFLPKGFFQVVFVDEKTKQMIMKGDL